MELLEYQIEDIRRAVREYVEKFADVEISNNDDDIIKIGWETNANERAALLELCQMITNAVIDHGMRQWFEECKRGIPE